MSFLESVIARTRQIERLLGELGGEGKGVHERVTSLRLYLADYLSKRLRYIASVRNKMVHTDGYKFDRDEATFLAVCDDTIAELQKLFNREGRLTSVAGRFHQEASSRTTGLISAYLWALLMPLIGLWKGLILMWKGKRQHGFFVIILSLATSAMWYCFWKGFFEHK